MDSFIHLSVRAESCSLLFNNDWRCLLSAPFLIVNYLIEPWGFLPLVPQAHH